MSFTTLDNVKLFLGSDTLTIQETALLDGLIVMVDGVIENYCGWKMLSRSYTSRKYDGNGATSLDLRTYPVTALTSVLVDSTDVTASVSADEEEGSIYYTDGSTTFTSGTKNIEVTFFAGFSDANMPPDLSYAATYLTVLDFNRVQDQSIGIGTEAFEKVNTAFTSSDLPQLVRRVLDRYRMLSIF